MENASCISPYKNISHYFVELSRHIDQLKKKLKDKNKSFVEGSDLFVFKELCTHENSRLRGVACNAIVDLVKSNLFPRSQAFAWFIAILQSNAGSIHDGVIRALTDLLLLNEKNQLDICSAEHPFILALKQNSQNWPTIEFHIEQILKRGETENFQQAFSILIPVFQYALWSPVGVVDVLCRRAAWKCLINNFREENLPFLVDTLCWIPTNDRYAILDVHYFLSDYQRLHEIIKIARIQDTICVYYAYTSCKLALYGHTPEYTLRITRKLLKTYPSCVNVVLVLFAETLTRCPAEFLDIFLKTSVELMKCNEYSIAAVDWLIISAILPWILHSFDFIAEIHETAGMLFDLVRQPERYVASKSIQSSRLLSDEYFIRVVNSEKDMYRAFVVACSLENQNRIEFLERIEGIQIRSDEAVHCALLFQLIISAILLSEKDANTQIKALDVLIKFDAAFYLPHILYLLAQAPSAELQLKLLHSLPFTALEKENISPVLKSIDSLFLSKKPILINLSIELYLCLWKIEERCYSCLHDRLIEYENISVSNENLWHRDIILVSAIRDICASKPGQRGEEWVSILNEIIKRWHKKKDGSLPSALALEAITFLCRAEVLEVVSIYEMLAQRLFEDDRVEVMIRFHILIECMIETTKKEAFDEFKDVVLHAVSKLWLVVSTSSQNEIVFSAMSALSKFDKDEMILEDIPEVYKKHLKLSRKYVESSENYVPGNLWIWFLKSLRPDVRLKAVDMLIRWFKEEVDNFPKSWYGTIRGEPKDLKILHDKYLYKALVDYLIHLSKQKDTFDENDLEIGIICLKILNAEMSKTLPLLNWSFLLKLLEIRRFDLTEQIIALFAKQSCTSFSARVAIENYLKNFQIPDQVNDLKIVLNVISDLSCGVSTVILKNFFESTKEYVLGESLDSDGTLWALMCDCFAKTLKSTDIDENNRICISEYIKVLWETIPLDNKVFDNLVNVTVELPSTYIDYLCSFDDVESSLDKVNKIIKLQLAMAIKSKDENPFIWVQKSIEIMTRVPETNTKKLCFDCLLPIIKRYRSHHNCRPWLLQFTSYIYSNIDKLSDAAVNFVCDIFVSAVVSLSIYEPFISNNFSFEKYQSFFSQALSSIVINENANRIVEWLLFMIKSSKLNQKYVTLFHNAVISSKNTERQNFFLFSRITQKLYPCF